jgi:hypothetical protein
LAITLEAHSLVVGSPTKVLDFYAGFCANRATCVKADGKDITELKLLVNSNSAAEEEVDPSKG